jgi:hypothetical protein
MRMIVEQLVKHRDIFTTSKEEKEGRNSERNEIRTKKRKQAQRRRK